MEISVNGMHFWISVNGMHFRNGMHFWTAEILYSIVHKCFFCQQLM